MPRQYKACFSRVHGSKPPASFLDQLVDWALAAPQAIFLPNAKFDILSGGGGDLGPWGSGAHRKAVGLEFLGVLAGRERNGRWPGGVDRRKSVKNTSHNEEAGAFQVSADSMGLDKGLK